MQRPDFARICVASFWIGVSGVASLGCNVYKRDLLEQNRAPDAGQLPHTDAATDAGTEPDGAGSDSGLSSFDPDTCNAGDCWWSTGSVDSCRSAGLPLPGDRPPGGDDTARISDIYLGFTQLRLGSTNPEGEQSEDAWQHFGLDLDGLCTNSSTCDGESATSCKAGGPAVPFDGELCRDNTFARLQPVIAAVPELGERFGLSEDAFNCELWRGGWNTVVRIRGYNGEANDPLVRVDFYQSTGMQDEKPAWTCPAKDFTTKYPRWLPGRKWSIADNWLTGPVASAGTLPDSKFADVEAYVKHGYLVARLPDGSEQGFIGNGASYRGFVYKTLQSVFVGRLTKAQDGTWNMRDGLTAGRIRKTDLVQAFRDIGFCESGDLAAFYMSMLNYVDENADLLANGRVDPGATCDAMSYAIAFEAAQLSPGTAVPAPKRYECCPPDKSDEQCGAVCGDGKKTGDEKCDTKIAAGQPGACPTTCPRTTSCAPQTVTGSACTAECTPMPITMAGAADGCCPEGGNETSDKDCTPKCGNGVVETGESCDPPSSCKACAPTNPCLPERMTGSADACTLRCEPMPITRCNNGDGCCPSTCSSSNDRDCSASCGNSRLDPGETCEANTPMPCAMNCNDGQACTTDTGTGSPNNCNLVCTHAPITRAANGDGCCPPNVGANDDSDCKPTCGNKLVEGTEQCDDGNMNAGDGCNNCMTESQQQICLVKLAATDACAQCVCQKCTSQGIACYGARDANDSKLCKDVVDCGRANNCGNPDCYCGSASTLICLAGGGSGKCFNQTVAAAKTGSPLDIQLRSGDPNYPLGDANAIADCVNINCKTECGR